MASPVSNSALLPLNKQNVYKTHEDNVSRAMNGHAGWTELGEPAKIARFHLNKEYCEKALIKNKVVYLYYPAQTIPLLGHTHFDIEGRTCYAACGVIELKKNKNISADNYAGQTHLQFRLHVTPKELERINNFIDFKATILPSTCSGNTATIIGKDTALNIPFPLSVSPLLSGSYLQVRKFCGWNRIGDVTYMAKKDSWNYYIRPLIGIIGELFTVCIYGTILTNIAMDYLIKQPLIN